VRCRHRVRFAPAATVPMLERAARMMLLLWLVVIHCGRYITGCSHVVTFATQCWTNSVCIISADMIRRSFDAPLARGQPLISAGRRWYQLHQLFCFYPNNTSRPRSAATANRRSSFGRYVCIKCRRGNAGEVIQARENTTSCGP
jgi:hypothetical protein